MTYSVFDQNGYVGDLCTITGLTELRDYLLGKDPVFTELFDDGCYEDPEKLVSVLMLLPQTDNPDIQNTVNQLLALSKNCVGIVMIGDDEGAEGLTSTNAQDQGEVFNEETPGGTYQRTVTGINKAIANLEEELFKELGL